MSEIAECASNLSEGGNGAGIGLKITAYDKDGNKTAEVCKDGDLFLKNWAVMIAATLKYGFNYTGQKSYIFTKEDGQTLYLAAGAAYFYAAHSYWINTGRVVLGSSTALPTINDYRLGAPLIEITPNLPVLQNNGNVIKVIFTATASFENQVTVSEVGIKIENPVSQDSFVYITRDTFDPVTVTAGGTITIQFEMWFNGMPS